MDQSLVPGRSCGTCTVCCVSLTIDDPELQKVTGYRCRNLKREGGCSIYESRPRTCRAFFCGWRTMRWVREPLRPDLSGVLVQPHDDGATSGGHGVTFILLRDTALQSEGLAETVAAAVAAGVRTYISIPGPPGHTSSHVQVNEVLGDAVHFKDKAGLLKVLRRVRAMARGGSYEPIVLAPRTAAPPNGGTAAGG